LKALVIHPINEDLRFLKKLKRKLKNAYSHLILTRSLSNNYSSHEQALNEINILDENDLIIILCHGGTRSIHGAQFREKYGSHRSKYVHSEAHGNFIDKSNIDIFLNKKVFCLSCNSVTLGNLAIENGAKVFVGFNTVDFDDRYELLPNQNPRHYVIARTKFALRTAVFNSLKFSLDNDLTFLQLIHVLKIFLNKEMDKLIILNKTNPGFEYYKQAANCILKIKEGVKLFGDGSIKILDR